MPKIKIDYHRLCASVHNFKICQMNHFPTQPHSYVLSLLPPFLHISISSLLYSFALSTEHAMNCSLSSKGGFLTLSIWNTSLSEELEHIPGYLGT